MEFEILKKNYTNINEPARKFLNISRDEYGFCAYVQYRSADPRQKIRGWCCDPKEEIAEWVGISRPGLYKMIDRLEGQKLLETDAKGNLSVTGYWIDVENNCKQSLQSEKEDVNKVYKDGVKSVNLVTHNKELDKEKEGIGENANEYTFGQFWDDYDFKVGSKKNALRGFGKLKPLEREQIRDTLTMYKADTSTVETTGKNFKKMRKQPEFYLSGKMWEPYAERLAAQKAENETFAPEWSEVYAEYLGWVECCYPKSLKAAKYLSKQQYVRYKTTFYVEGKSYIDEKREREFLIQAHDDVEKNDDLRARVTDIFAYHCELIKERLKMYQI